MITIENNSSTKYILDIDTGKVYRVNSTSINEVRRYRTDGYLRVKLNGKETLVHELVMDHIMPNREAGVVHHINGVKDDNNSINLVLMDRSLHSKLHNLQDLFPECLGFIHRTLREYSKNKVRFTEYDFDKLRYDVADFALYLKK